MIRIQVFYDKKIIDSTVTTNYSIIGKIRSLNAITTPSWQINSDMRSLVAINYIRSEKTGFFNFFDDSTIIPTLAPILTEHIETNENFSKLLH